MDKQVGMTALILVVIGVLAWIAAANWDLLGIGDGAANGNGNGDADTSNDNGNGTTGGGDPNGGTGETGSNGTARMGCEGACDSGDLAMCQTLGYDTCTMSVDSRFGGCTPHCGYTGGGERMAQPGFHHRRTRQRNVA